MNICKNNADKWEPNWNKHILDMHYTHKLMSHRPTTMASKRINWQRNRISVSHQLLGTLIVLQERMVIGPGSWSFRLPTSHLRHRCKGQHPWSSGKIRFLVGCGNPRFFPRPWIHSNRKLPVPSPQSILYFCENPQVSTGMNGNMRQHTYCQWAREKSLCASFSVSLVHAL